MFQQLTTELRWSSSPCLQGWHQPLTQKGKYVVLLSFWLHLHHQYSPDVGNTGKFKVADVIYQVVTNRSFYLFSSRDLNSHRDYYWGAKSIVCLNPKINPLPACMQQKKIMKLCFVVHSEVIDNLYCFTDIMQNPLLWRCLEFCPQSTWKMKQQSKRRVAESDCLSNTETYSHPHLCFTHNQKIKTPPKKSYKCF